jgi:hypothetical protein
MTHNPEFIPMTEALRQALRDWSYMISYLKTNPTSVMQLVADEPWFIGYSDACGLGAGGIWCSGTKQLAPILWQVEWPPDIKTSLITSENRSGTITINDLELAGIVLNWMALEQTNINLLHAHIATFCDNTSTVSWSYKMRTSKSVAAGKLLRVLGMRIHQRQASTVIPSHIAGDKNDMADIVSRAFKTGKFFAASNSLTTYFNQHFPLPQNQSWTELPIPPRWTSRVMSCLRGEMLDLASLLELPTREPSTGSTGAHMPTHVASVPGSMIHPPLQCDIVLMAFAARVRSGHFGKQRKIKAGGVADALAAISTTFQLAGKPSPIHRSENKYRLSLQRQMESYRREDPPSIPNLAVPVSSNSHLQGWSTKYTT